MIVWIAEVGSSAECLAAYVTSSRRPSVVTYDTVCSVPHPPVCWSPVGKYDARMPAVLKSAAAQGHLIEPHTWDHAYPTAANGYSALPYLSSQIKTTAAQQRALTGKPTCFFRPPGGHMNNVNAAAKLNNMRTVLWSVDTQDWSQPPYLSATAQAAILKKGTDLRYANPSHPILLMHAGKASNEPESKVSSFRGNTVAALPKIIAWYKARGYRFVAMDGTSGLIR